MALRPIRTLSVCSGIGGLELGLQLALPNRTRCVCYVEREGFAAACLVARMEDEILDKAPIWSEIGTFDGTAWRGAVDLVTAGVPCQPVSQAGRALGVEDERWFWPELARIIKETEAPAVFMENVPGLVRRGLAEIHTNLSALGFDAVWDCVSAEQIGATHLRERVFILGVRHTYDGATRALEEIRRTLADTTGARQSGRAGERSASNGQFRKKSSRSSTATPREMADTNGTRRQQVSRSSHGDEGADAGRSAQDGDIASGSLEDVADPDLARRKGWIHDAQRSARERIPRAGGLAFPRFPPRPHELEQWAEILHRSPRLEPAVRRMAHGIPDRLDRLRALGNAVVPSVAAEAWRELAPQAAMILLHWDEMDEA